MTNSNPWDDEPEMDEAPEQEAPAADTPAFGVKLTFKRGKGYEEPWITVFGPGIREVLEEIKAHKDELKELMTGTSRMAGHFHAQAGSQPAAAGSGSPAPSAPSGGGRPAYQQAPGGETRSCKHGEMTFRSRVGDGGKVEWQGFFCPQPRDAADKCKAQYLR